MMLTPRRKEDRQLQNGKLNGHLLAFVHSRKESLPLSRARMPEIVRHTMVQEHSLGYSFQKLMCCH